MNLLDKIRQDLNGAERAKAQTVKVAVMPDGTEYVLRKANRRVMLDNGTSASTVRSAIEHFQAAGAKIETRQRH